MVRLHGGEGEARNLFVGDDRLGLDLLGETAEPGTENDGNFGAESGAAAHCGGRLLNPVESAAVRNEILDHRERPGAERLDGHACRLSRSSVCT